MLNSTLNLSCLFVHTYLKQMNTMFSLGQDWNSAIMDTLKTTQPTKEQNPIQFFLRKEFGDQESK